MRQAHSPTVAFKTRAAQSRTTSYIAAFEWRWVVFVGCGLVLLAFLPLLWVALMGTGSWQFMGVLHNYLDGATYLAKMALGAGGDWMVVFQHTPETHTGAFIQTLYPLLGQLARVTGIPLIVMFHVARVFASLFMYAALYQLGAAIWTRVRARRVFLVIAATGAGFGWLFAPLTGLSIFPDFPLIPEAFPFFSTLVNVHFPLAIGVLALLVGMFIAVFRPGAEEDRALAMSFPIAGLLSLLLAFLYPQALVPLAGAVVLSIVVMFARERWMPRLVWTWTLALILPPIPILLYIMSLIAYNPAMARWNLQNVTPSPPLWALIIGLGLPLLVGLPGIYRAVRRFERDGDRFMLLWLVCMVILMLLPSNIQRRFGVGLMLPVAYFATRAIEDVWLPHIARRWRKLLFALFVPLAALSQILMLLLPVLPLTVGTPEQAVGIFLPRDYRDVFEWLGEHTTDQDVVLASPVVSTWIPGWTGARVVYGHPYETLDADAKLQLVNDWYAGTGDCAALLDRYNVRYVLYGQQESQLGEAPCRADLRLIARSGDVAIYAP